MELEKQVVSLELARKLKELGVKQESAFYWVSFDDFPNIVSLWPNASEPSVIHASAYTQSELTEMFPPFFYVKKRVRCWEYWLHIERLSHGWIIDVSSTQDTKRWLHRTVSRYIHEGLAEMLIYLIENNLVDVNGIRIDKAA